MNINTPRSIAARLVLIGGLAASGAAILPSLASAGNKLGCVGRTIEATSNGQTLYGTACNDTFKLGPFGNVTIYAGDGDDTVRAGFVGTNWTNYIYLEGGNDTVLNPNDRGIWVNGGAGNDTVKGSSHYDAFYGGTGFDTFIGAMPGDFYNGVENFV